MIVYQGSFDMNQSSINKNQVSISINQDLNLFHSCKTLQRQAEFKRILLREKMTRPDGNWSFIIQNEMAVSCTN